MAGALQRLETSPQKMFLSRYICKKRASEAIEGTRTAALGLDRSKKEADRERF
jgi:hypothetical protein